MQVSYSLNPKSGKRGNESPDRLTKRVKDVSSIIFNLNSKYITTSVPNIFTAWMLWRHNDVSDMATVFIQGDSTQKIHETRNHLMAGILSYSIHPEFGIAKMLLE